MSPVLWHVVRATGLDRETSEDVIQNTWLTLVRSADSVRDAQAITRWLCTSARRESWRVSKAATRLRPVDDDVLAARMPEEASPESEVVTNDENALLWEALTRLPERCQKLLRIVAWEPRPDYSSVAESLEMPIGSIGPTRRRCLDKLRIELGELLMTRSDDDLLRSVADALRRARPRARRPRRGRARPARGARTSRPSSSCSRSCSRSTPGPAPARASEPETSTTVALEFAGSTYRVLVRISDADDGAEGGRRVDGWVVPALPAAGLPRPPGRRPGAHPPERVRRPRRPLRVPRRDARRGAAVAAAPGRA